MMREDGPLFQLSLPVFEGSVDDLLQLVSKGKIASTDLALAEVTGQFQRYMIDADWADLDLTGDFVSASARLLEMKSAALLILGTAEDDEAEHELRRRDPDMVLREISGTLAARAGLESFAPDVSPVVMARATEPRSPSILLRVWEAMERRGAAPAQRVAVPAFVRLEVAFSRLLRQLRGSRILSFARAVSGLSRNDVVIHFLAVLELVRRQQATAVQDELFDDIVVEWNSDERAGEQRVG